MQIETVPHRQGTDDDASSPDQPNGGAWACRILGRFDAHESEQFRTYFDETIAQGAKIFIVDLSEVDFVDSTALAELVRAMKQLRQDGGNLILRRPSNAVRIILELTKLDLAFTIEAAA